MASKHPINESTFPSIPAPAKLRETYDALRVASIGNNISSGLKISHRDKLIDQLYVDLREMRGKLKEASQGKLEALQRMDELIAQIESDAKIWEQLEVAGDDLTAGIDLYRRGIGPFAGGRPISALIGACYRFLTLWRSTKILRQQRNEQTVNLQLNSANSTPTEARDSGGCDGDSTSNGRAGSGDGQSPESSQESEA